MITAPIILPEENKAGENEKPSLPVELHVGFSTSSPERQSSFPAFRYSLWRIEGEVPSYIITNRKQPYMAAWRTKGERPIVRAKLVNAARDMVLRFLLEKKIIDRKTPDFL